MVRRLSLSIVLLFCCAPLLQAKSMTPKANTHEAVKAYVEHAARLVASKGADCAALKSANWMAGDYYIFVVGPDGRAVCHPSPQIVGKPLSEIIDANGKKVGEALMAAANAGGGWVDYIWPRPGTTTPVPKSSYAVKVKGPDGKSYVVGSGGYDLK